MIRSVVCLDTWYVLFITDKNDVSLILLAIHFQRYINTLHMHILNDNVRNSYSHQILTIK